MGRSHRVTGLTTLLVTLSGRPCQRTGMSPNTKAAFPHEEVRGALDAIRETGAWDGNETGL